MTLGDEMLILEEKLDTIIELLKKLNDNMLRWNEKK